MQKKNMWVLGVVVVVVVAAGGYAIFHKMSKPAATSSSAVVSNSVLTTKTDSTVGQYLADTSGRALYTYASDSSGVSNCTGSCLANWPAYQDNGSTTGLPTGIGTIKRTDNGQTQYTYNGMPLYYFVSDGQGQVTGDGVAGFQVAKPSSTTSPSSNSGSSSGRPY